MPRVGIISDIHGNLEALKAVLEALEADRIEQVIHLGDLVGYNANPRECLELVQEHGIVSILGNHDLGILDPQTADNFNVIAYQALNYSRQQLTAKNLLFLQDLPSVEVLRDQYLMCHGSPENVGTYILDVFRAKRIFNLLQKRHSDIRVCFFGHTHRQALWVRDERGKVFAPPSSSNSVPLQKENVYLINPGSVGQPRQLDNRAHYATFDSDSETVHFRAVPYDILKAQRKILEADLPRYLALRLQDGI